MTLKTEGTHAGGFIVSEPDINLSRKLVTLAVGIAFAAGTVLAKYTSGPNTGKYTRLTPGASDGSQTADGILFEAVNAVAADAEGVAVHALASFNPSELVWPAGISDVNKAAAITALAAKNLVAMQADPPAAIVGASRLVFLTVPSGGVEGTDVGDVQVRIENDEGVLMTGATDTITLAKATGPGTVTVDDTTVDAVGGIATFTGTTFSVDGTYTLTASASGLDSDTSGGIVITNA